MTMKTIKAGLLAAALALTVGSAVTTTASAHGFGIHFGGVHFGGHFGGGRFAGHWGGPRWAGFYGPRWGYRYRVIYPVVYRPVCGC